MFWVTINVRNYAFRSKFMVGNTSVENLHAITHRTADFLTYQDRQGSLKQQESGNIN